MTRYYVETRKKGISYVKEKRRKANWIGHILRRNCLIKHVIEGKKEERIEVAGKRGRRSKQLLNDLKKTMGYCKLKVEAQDRTVWRTGVGRGCRPRFKTDCCVNIGRAPWTT
jgi:IMP dehydrogenase/GMP reductase